MSEDQLQAFLSAVAADSNLKEQLKTTDPITVAKQAGFNFSIEDLKAAKHDLSDEELEKAAGGGVCAAVDFSLCRLWDGSL